MWKPNSEEKTTLKLGSHLGKSTIFGFSAFPEIQKTAACLGIIADWEGGSYQPGCFCGAKIPLKVLSLELQHMKVNCTRL